MRKIWLPVFLSFLSLLAASAFGGVWGSRGITQRFAAKGDILYAAEGRGVAVYDVRNAAQPRRIDVELSDDETYDVALSGSNELLAATARGLERFTIAADGTLTRVGATDDIGHVVRVAAGTNYAAATDRNLQVFILDRNLEDSRKLTFRHNVKAIAFVGDLLYVSVDVEGIAVYDAATLARVATVPAKAEDFARAGNTLWTASLDDALTAIDVTRPSAPRILGHTGATEIRLTALAVSGNRAYAIELPDRLHVFDITDPSAPRLLSTTRDWVRAVGASGTRVFLSGPELDFENRPYETGVPLRVYDASNAAALRVAGEVHDAAGPVSGVWTDGSIAYVVDPPYLRVLDVSKTDAPRELSSMKIDNIQDQIRVRNGIAILYGRSNVGILDVSNPLAPRYLGTYDALGHPPSVAALSRDSIIEGNMHSGLHVVDFSDPTHAVQVGGRLWDYYDLAATDDAIYALQVEHWWAFQINDRHQVVDRTYYQLQQYKQIDTAPPNSAYPPLLLLRGGDDLRVYSLLEDRFAPREIAVLPIANTGLFGTGDGVAYITKDGELSRLNLREPEALEPTGYAVTAPMQISVAGEKVVVADRYSLRVYGPDTPSPVRPAKRRSARH
ncbi:MAG TPA: hypothetical protein VF824_06365 [Thermoanaerobaculia bacterium]